jgi:hypothetical protein
MVAIWEGTPRHLMSVGRAAVVQMLGGGEVRMLAVRMRE